MKTQNKIVLTTLLMMAFTACSCPTPEPKIETIEVPRIVPCKVPSVVKPKIITYSASEAPSVKIVKVYENYLNMKNYAQNLELASKVCQ